MQQINPHAAGIDIGSRSIFVSVADQPVVQFTTFTDDLVKLVDYLKTHQITTVAMEATGSYWFVLYDMIEQASLEVCLVNGAHVKNVPGRKTDVQDCQWLQQLHSYGLLHKSFVPTEEIRILRDYRRHREELVGRAADSVRHMQKALDLMNIKVHTVINQLKGVSGLRIVDAILAGERNPAKLSELCDPQILKKKAQQVERSLHGTWKTEHLFALKQSRKVYQNYQDLIAECDAQIDTHLKSMGSSRPEPPTKRTIPTKPISNNPPKIPNLGSKLLRLTGGIDATTIPGFNDRTVLQLIAETGLDLSRWPTSGHFTSWLGLAPHRHQSGQTNKTRRNKHKTQAAQILRLMARSISRTQCALRGFYHRINSRKGPAIAIVATARKLAVLYYNLMRHGAAFVEKGLEHYQKSQHARKVKILNNLAASEGFKLVPAEP